VFQKFRNGIPEELWKIWQVMGMCEMAGLDLNGPLGLETIGVRCTERHGGKTARNLIEHLGEHKNEVTRKAGDQKRV
jgi:hypothetical protein